MARSMREGGQPTPKQVATDALSSIPIPELARAVPAQDAKDEIIIIEDGLSALEYSENKRLGVDELKAATDELSEGISFIVSSIAIYEDVHQIPEIYVPKPDRVVRHSSPPEDNHVWRLVSPQEGTLEVRTGPFVDRKVGKTYEPELKVTLPGGKHQRIANDTQAYAKAIRIIADVFPHGPALMKGLGRLVGN